MPRHARLALPGVAWHIIQRGNNRSACFFTSQDRHTYLAMLREQADEHGCQVHAYVLMTNHVHLLATPAQAQGVSLMMKHLGQRYVQYVNRRHARSGTLWEGRFRSSLVQDEHYVLACYRYIELNPVRAGMVPRASEYAWSSHAANGQGRSDPLVRSHPQYEALGSTPGARRRAYRRLFDEPLAPPLLKEIRSATNGNFALGGDRFRAGIEALLGRRAAPGARGRPRLKDDR
jgi:putative transposase